MSQLYYNDVVTDLASCDTANETINYLRRIDDARLDNEEWQEILEDTADKLDTTVDIILSCFDQLDDTDFESYIKAESI